MAIFLICSYVHCSTFLQSLIQIVQFELLPMPRYRRDLAGVYLGLTITDVIGEMVKSEWIVISRICIGGINREDPGSGRDIGVVKGQVEYTNNSK